MAVMCGLIFLGIAMTLAGYGIAVAISLFLDNIYDNNFEDEDIEELNPIE